MRISDWISDVCSSDLVLSSFRRSTLLVGYARVSTRDQSPALQLNALREAGCEKVFTEKASGAQRDRPELRAALDGSVAKIVKLEHAWRRLDGRNGDGFQVAPFPGCCDPGGGERKSTRL